MSHLAIEARDGDAMMAINALLRARNAGKIHYPSGQAAESAGELFYYSGQTALNASGECFFPNGRKALEDGFWCYPSGERSTYRENEGLRSKVDSMDSFD